MPQIAIDLRILGFAVALSLLTGIVFGLAPSLAASRADLLGGLREDSRGSIGGNSGLRRGLVAAEVALSVALLAGAGLLFRSLIGLQGVDPGLDASGVLTFRVSLPGARYPEASKRVQFYQTRARADPGTAGRALGQRDQLPSIPRHGCRHARQYRGTAASQARRGTGGHDSHGHARLLPGDGNPDSQRTRFLRRRQHGRVSLSLHHQRELCAQVPARASSRSADRSTR